MMGESSHTATIEREFGPFEGADGVHGVTFDGSLVWACTGNAILGVDPSSGEVLRRLAIRGRAGTAFDGVRLYQLAGPEILVIDREDGTIVRRLPAPGDEGNSGLAWAEGSLWLGRYRERLVLELDPASGAVRRTIRSDRFVTGVTWTAGELWHGTFEDGVSELRRVDPTSGEVVERLVMPEGTMVSGLEADGGDRFFAGGGAKGTLRVVSRTRREPR